MGLLDFDIADLLMRLPVVLFSLTIHEFMHGYVAWKCGDDTAYRAGRLTLNPLAHLDLMGTLCLLFAPIGWAKPVPVVPSNFAYATRRRDEILVSGAGIAANFVLGAACALGLRFFTPMLMARGHLGAILWTMLFYGSFINFGLALFNLLPIPPLDGSHMLRNLLPLNAAILYSNLRPYGPYALLGFVLFNMYAGQILGFNLLDYPVSFLVKFLAGLGRS